ncbi:hypothetical protein Mgra_00000734 [Meloidogyne graminicola]|uniref:Transmembrane protein n=1 Tax=Meloidogyne graminicola TaxID=189291 RepID=A0A8T0A178_9BILA|nr:hypothetical protein Mgra_00000734 [Meloidogyne graminicola]
MSKITTKIFLKIITFLLFLLATTLNSSNAGSVRRHNRHHQQQKKDRVPISTDSSSSSSNYSKTNRFTSKYPTKLRKFREDIGHKNNDDDIVERRRWLEELFGKKGQIWRFVVKLNILFLSSIFNKIVEIKIIFVLYYPFRRENVPLVVEDVYEFF